MVMILLILHLSLEHQYEAVKVVNHVMWVGILHYMVVAYHNQLLS